MQSPVVETPPKMKARHEGTTTPSPSLVSEEEISYKRKTPPILHRTFSFPARMKQAERDTEKAGDDEPVPHTPHSHFREEIMQHCRNSGATNRIQRASASATTSSVETTNQKATEVDINESRPSCSTPSSSRSEPIIACSIDTVEGNPDEKAMNASGGGGSEETGSVEGEGGVRSSSMAAEAKRKESLDMKTCMERAEALEGLLELCADLVEQSKMEELAVVLKPFGREKVSPRDTAMWLAKSLKGMMLHNHHTPST